MRALPLEALRVAVVFAFTNAALVVFHLLPIPGLDGARIVGLLLPPQPREVYRNADKYLPLFVLVALFVFSTPDPRVPHDADRRDLRRGDRPRLPARDAVRLRPPRSVGTAAQAPRGRTARAIIAASTSPAASSTLPATRSRVLTGYRPTGPLHVGHWAGNIESMLALQDDPARECFFFIADWHMLTTHYDRTDELPGSRTSSRSTGSPRASTPSEPRSTASPTSRRWPR